MTSPTIISVSHRTPPGTPSLNADGTEWNPFIVPASVHIAPGDTVMLTLQFHDVDDPVSPGNHDSLDVPSGAPKPPSRLESATPSYPHQVDWTSRNSDVASITARHDLALLTGLSPGVTQVTATLDGHLAHTLVTVASPPDPTPPIPAFPGAEGWGATALAHSRRLPLAIHFVTSTAADGPGTLSDALASTSDSRYDIVLFRVGGVFAVPPDGALRLNRSHVYIAGQTAPQDGVTLDGAGRGVFWLRGPRPTLTDVVLRYIRIRGAHTSINISQGQRIVLDHLSISWATNHLLSILRYPFAWSHPIADVSLQNSILSEVLSGHPTALNIGAQDPHRTDPDISIRNISIHKNLFAHNSHRNPLSGADNALIANNVLYNWNQGTVELRWRGKVDVINNFGKKGPMTLRGMSRHYTYMVNPHCSEPHVLSIYATGNVGPMSYDAEGDNWNGDTRQVACYYNTGDHPGAEIPSDWRRSAPQAWADAPFPVDLLPATQVYSQMLASVGASKTLSCEGEWHFARDLIDARVVEEVRTSTGVDRPLATAGTFDGVRGGVPCPDADGDGLPDAWETRFFGCGTCADPAAKGKDGYLLIEHYLNGTPPL